MVWLLGPYFSGTGKTGPQLYQVFTTTEQDAINQGKIDCITTNEQMFVYQVDPTTSLVATLTPTVVQT